MIDVDLDVFINNVQLILEHAISSMCDTILTATTAGIVRYNDEFTESEGRRLLQTTS